MAAPSVASRSTRSRQGAEPDDVMIARALAASEWARKNVRVVITAAVVALLVVGGLLYYRMYRADRLESAATEFVTMQQTAASGNVALASSDLQRYIGRFDGTVYADEARILLAELQLQGGQAAQAVTTLQAFAGRINDSPVGAQGAMLLGAAHESAGNTQEAVQTYLTVADEVENDFRRVTALSNAASLREALGDNAGAAELYGRIVELTEEGSAERSAYEMRQAEAAARAQAK